MNVSDLKSGTWCCLNNIQSTEHGNLVTNLLLVEKNYLEKNSNTEHYKWQTSEDFIEIEKGIVGVFNQEFTDENSENHYQDCDDTTSNSNQAGILNDVAVLCKTPYGNDGCFSFDFCKENAKIVGLKINFNNGLD